MASLAMVPVFQSVRPWASASRGHDVRIGISAALHTDPAAETVRVIVILAVGYYGRAMFQCLDLQLADNRGLGRMQPRHGRQSLPRAACRLPYNGSKSGQRPLDCLTRLSAGAGVSRGLVLA